MPEQATRCNKCNKSFLTSTNPTKQKDLCGKCSYKSKGTEVTRKERIAREHRIEQGYLEGHNRHEREPYFRETLGTAWGIRKAWMSKDELLRLRKKYEDNTTPINKVTRRRPKTKE